MELMKNLDFNKYKDPGDWDLVDKNLVFVGQGPNRLLAFISLYLLFVLKVGPTLMNKKQPYDLRSLVRVYNFFNIIFNIWLAWRGIHLSGGGRNFFNCNCAHSDTKRFAIYLDILLLSRVIDFMDTVFFILRKKYNQVTGLHVFHHAMVPMAIYSVAVFSMSPFSGFLILLNSIVHTVMYSYYFLATFPSLVPHLWWKRYITRIQIGQFLAGLTYYSMGAILLPRYCNQLPLMTVLINLGSALIFLILFLSFYSGAYRPRSPSVKQEASAKCLHDTDHNANSTTKKDTLTKLNIDHQSMSRNVESTPNKIKTA